MNATVTSISLVDLSFAFIPVFFVLYIFYRWQLNALNASYALFRMLIQLLLIGYFLAFIFEAKSAWIVGLVLIIMLLASSWIALGSIKKHRKELYLYTLIAIFIGGGSSLLLMTQAVLHLNPWFEPHYMVPLAGMVFANAMNSVSLSAERLFSEKKQNIPFTQARNTAFQASMIPVINSLFAVGLVSLPGMMTGQILSGIDPFIAARYQIMIMAMIFSGSGIASAYFLTRAKKVFESI
ncbi:MAG: ABC transporter permease [Thiovulaceae bacterium]|nr:ABC transporter permease [Sulfurimonadaceae bacterium]